MIEYRPVGVTHRERLEAIHRHAFEPERGPLRPPSEDEEDGAEDAVENADVDAWPPDLFDPRGVFDGDELVSVCVRYTLAATVRGEWTEIGGLGGVATPPEHRHNGYARFLLRNALEEYREEDVALVTLWPASTPFYREAGWATANRYAECRVPPSALSAVRGGSDGEPAGRVRQLSADDWERLRVVEEHRAERVGLSLRRSEQWWRERTLGPWPDEPAPYVYGYERDGDLRGYVVYSFAAGGDGALKDPDFDRQLEVQDVAAVDDEAERALLAFLADHDSQADTIRLRGRIAEDCFDRGVDPDAIDCSLEAGAMVRVTDVALALERHDWSAVPDATLDFAVSDPLLAHNDGRFRVAIEDGSAAVLPADDDGRFDATDGRSGILGDDAEPAVHVDVGTLSQLCVGSVGIERAERVGGLDVRSESARDVLEAAFEPAPVCLREFF